MIIMRKRSIRTQVKEDVILANSLFALIARLHHGDM